MKERFEVFTVLISNLYRCINKIKTEEMNEFNLKGSHISCLYYIFKNESLTAKELCDICGEDKSNMSRTIKYLENNGYLNCALKTQKKYLSQLELTEKGKEVAKLIAYKIDNILKFSSEGISEENRNIMYQSLSVINKNLNKLCEAYKTEND